MLYTFHNLKAENVKNELTCARHVKACILVGRKICLTLFKIVKFSFSRVDDIYADILQA